MPRIHVCPLARIDETVAATGARSLVTLLNPGTPVERPAAIAAERHLYIAVGDIVEAQFDHVLPAERHVSELLAFVQTWDRAEPLLIHCYAGVSRSTAAAFITARALRAASPTATPNTLLVALADATLHRGGRMIKAVAAIGRGAECFEGAPFALELA
jgi:predicted protein tyrosine phosphatase